MPQINILVKGYTPKPWGTNEQNWRRVLADAAIPLRPTESVASGTQFTVEIVFLLTTTHIRRADLDNLAKPILDTLFKPYRPQVKDLSLTGAFISFDDSQVFKLILEKQVVSTLSDEGANITISWL